MKEKLIALRPWLIRIFGYPAFFTFFFLLFLYVTFPYDRLREAIVAAAEAPRTSPSGRTTPSNVEIAIGHLGPTFLPGLRARDVTVTFLPTQAGQRPTTMQIDRATVHVSLFALLGSKLNASFDVEGMGGEIEGDVSVYFGQGTAESPPGVRDLEMELKSVHVGEIAPLASIVGLPMGGTLDGTVEVHIPDGRIAQADGAIRITADRLTVGDGHAQYQIPHFGGVTVEQIRAGRLEANVAVRNGQAVFERVGSHSPEFDFQMDGRADLRPNLGDTALALSVRLRLTDVYRNKSEQAGRIVSVMDMAPDIRRARRPDGLLAFRCTGTVDRGVTCAPAPGAGGASSAPRRDFAP